MKQTVPVKIHVDKHNEHITDTIALRNLIYMSKHKLSDSDYEDMVKLVGKIYAYDRTIWSVVMKHETENKSIDEMLSKRDNS